MYDDGDTRASNRHDTRGRTPLTCTFSTAGEVLSARAKDPKAHRERFSTLRMHSDLHK